MPPFLNNICLKIYYNHHLQLNILISYSDYALQIEYFHLLSSRRQKNYVQTIIFEFYRSSSNEGNCLNMPLTLIVSDCFKNSK